MPIADVNLFYVLGVFSQNEAMIALQNELKNEGLPDPIRTLIYHWLTREEYLPLLAKLHAESLIDEKRLFTAEADQIQDADGKSLRLSQGIIYKIEQNGQAHYAYSTDVNAIPDHHDCYIHLCALPLAKLKKLVKSAEQGGYQLLPLDTQLGSEIEKDIAHYSNVTVTADPIPGSVPMVLRLMYSSESAPILKSMVSKDDLFKEFQQIPLSIWSKAAYTDTDELRASWTCLHLCYQLLGKKFDNLYAKADWRLFPELSDELLTRVISTGSRQYSLLYQLVAQGSMLLDRFYEEGSVKPPLAPQL